MGMMMHRNKLRREVAKATPLSNVKKKFEQPKVQEIKVEIPKYTRSDINTMSTANLQALGKELGIEDAENISGNKLKPIILEKLEL